MSNPTFTTEQLLALTVRTAIASDLMEQNPGAGIPPDESIELRCEVLARAFSGIARCAATNPLVTAHLNRIVHIFSENTPISAGEETEETL